MTVRATMVDLISTLRGFTNAGTADFTVAGVTYWSDEQLQQSLDRFRVDVREARLTAHGITNTGGSVEYKEYTTPLRWMESAGSGGSARFVVSDGIGNITPLSQYTPDYENGLIVFTNDQAGSARYLTAHTYDVYAAAADVWQQKAASYAMMIDFSTDGHSVKRSHVVAQCEAMAKRYQGMANSGGSTSGDIMRGDVRGY